MPGGWFWQTYDGQGNAWYQGSRVAAPAAGEETKVRIEYTETQATVTVNGQNAFGGRWICLRCPAAGAVPSPSRLPITAHHCHRRSGQGHPL